MLIPADSKNQTKVLAIIPCYNEAASIGTLLKEFEPLKDICDTLIIDDGSTDRSLQIASKLTHVIRFPNNQGVCATLKTGIGYAIEHGYPYCIRIDGDGQHPPGAIPDFIALARSRQANFVIGSRYRRNPMSYFRNPRAMASLVIALLLRCLFPGRSWLSDPFSGMWLMDRRAMEYYHTILGNLSLDPQIIGLVLRNNFHIAELPVVMRPRLHGVSYVAGLNGVKFLWRLIGALLRIRFLHYPTAPEAKKPES